MVFFTCNGCGEAIKKQQVEKHRQRCRRSHTVSCMDCGSDFRGSEYNGHIKCVSEREKYSGGSFQEKETKGEAKQQSWTDQVQKAIDQAKPTNFNLRRLLETLKGYTNIPRKQAKFKNFLSNSLGVRNEELVNEAWAAIAASSKDEQQQAIDENTKEETQNGATEQREASNNKRPHQEQLETSTETKKQKIEENNESKEQQLATTIEETTSNGNRKWKKKELKTTIRKILAETAERKMKLKKLRKAVVKTLSAENASEEELLACVDHFIPKCKRFIVEGKYISIAN
uniref:Zf-LYAR domain-containing protein n=1 Tax=Trichuris muris TaxID=70415 RepID=A0A5S6QTK4_TRIMR